MPVNNETNPLLGIDLGTTFSAIARWDGFMPRVYNNPQGQTTTQSVVFFDKKEQRFVVGSQAYNKFLAYPESGILGVKRLMDEKGRAIKLGDLNTNPVEVSSKILATLYGDVCAMYPKGLFDARGVVVTVPYYFKAHQVANTREAAEMASLNFIGVIQEPIAAALAYVLDMVRSNPDLEREETVLVFDLGGGTFDLTVFKLIQTRHRLIFEVLGTGGDDRLGGLDFDYELREHVIRKGNVDVSCLDEKQTRRATQKLMEGACTAKCALSFDTSYNLVIPFLTGDLHLDLDLSRQELEECLAAYANKVRTVVDQTLEDAGITPQTITRVIKVGGSSKIPLFSQMLEEVVGADKIFGDLDPSLCVAQGAAIYAAYLDDHDVLGREVEITTRNCHALGVEMGDGTFFPLVSKNARLPYESVQIFTTDEDNMTELDVAVYQGSAKTAKDNSLVGNVKVRGLVPKRKEELDIKITFRVSEEQRVSITIEEPQSGIMIMEALDYA